MTFLLPKHKRTRSPAYLAWLHDHGCVICGLLPVQAHHLTIAEPKGRGLRASDKNAVPLCRRHHDPNSGDSVHFAGDERKWWRGRGVKDPVALAASLYAEWEAQQQHLLRAW